MALETPSSTPHFMKMANLRKQRLHFKDFPENQNLLPSAGAAPLVLGALSALASNGRVALSWRVGEQVRLRHEV
jgi:hypothetical protein